MRTALTRSVSDDMARCELTHVARLPIDHGVPVVGLEPSCTSVFRDELGNLLYGDEDGARLARQTFLLSELKFLGKASKSGEQPRDNR